LSGAREDFALNARSLGRHERPRPGSNGDAFWFRPYVPKKPFAAIGGVVAGSAREALGFVARRTAAAGFSRILYKEMTRDEVAPARAVRVVVPDMETSNPFYTGIRARALLVADLLRRHAW
jgi:ribosomal protein S12 methylthiotransferase accessory factor